MSSEHVLRLGLSLVGPTCLRSVGLTSSTFRIQIAIVCPLMPGVSITAGLCSFTFRTPLDDGDN